MCQPDTDLCSCEEDGMVKYLVTMTQSDGLITPEYLSLSCFL